MDREWRLKWQMFLCKVFPATYKMIKSNIDGIESITITKIAVKQVEVGNRMEEREVLQVVGVY